jgi:hypothetical protein
MILGEYVRFVVFTLSILESHRPPRRQSRRSVRTKFIMTPGSATTAYTYIEHELPNCPQNRHPLSEAIQNHYLVGGKYRSVAYCMGLLFHVIRSIPHTGADGRPRPTRVPRHSWWDPIPPSPPGRGVGGEGVCSVRGVHPHAPRKTGCPGPPGRDSMDFPQDKTIDGAPEK